MPNNLHEASKLAQLDNLGSSLDAFDIQEQLPVLNQVCGEFIKRVQNNIQAKGLNLSGKISQIEIEETSNGVNIKAYPHLLYVDLGVNGNKVKLYDTPFSYKDKMPPVDTIKGWIKSRGIQTKNNPHFKSEKVDIDEGAAWAIAKHIQLYGQEPQNVYSKEIPQLVDDLQNAFSDFCVKQIFKAL